MSMKLLLESFKSYTQELLSEIKMEQVLPRFESKAFINAANQEYEASFSFDPWYQNDRFKGLTPQQIMADALQRGVPEDIEDKYKPEALNWLISSFIKYPNRTLAFGSAIREALELFYQIKQVKMDRILSKNSIHDIKDSTELSTIIKKAKPAWREYNEEKTSEDWQAGTNKIYEDENWEVYIPENKGAACKLGKGTDWCTAAPGLEYYKQYHKPEDPLIIFISKQDPTDKYQFHYGTRQFMNKDDADVSQTPVWYELNSIVANMDSPRLSDNIKEEAADYSEGFEKLPNGGYKVTSEYTISYFDKDNNHHREDGPAFVELMDGIVSVEQWFIHGIKDRKDGPAQTEYYITGKPWRATWYNNGYPGRKDGGPTKIEYDESGKVFQEEWFDSYGNRNRKDGPAIVRADGTKIWYVDGDKHRFDGPAWESPEGNQYFWRDDAVSKEEYEKRVDAYENVPFEESLKRMIKEELVKVLKEERKLGKPSSETSLRDWFKRKGAPGKKGGWVDCNTCRDGKCKPCGRQGGESRSKYPRCRPTPSQCKGYKRRGDNLQKEE